MMTNLTPRAQQVLALAAKEAARFNHAYVGTEHILLGLVKLGQGPAVKILMDLGVDLEVVRKQVERELAPKPPSLSERRAQLDTRLQSYFGNGGLFNPEHMAHDKVGELLRDLQQFIRDLPQSSS